VEAHALLPQSAGTLVGLSRASERSHDLIEKKSTQRVPLILEFLAGLKSAAHVKDAAQDIEMKVSTKKRKQEAVAPEEPKGFLKQFMVKKPT
jgi:hypothetical protein